MLHNVAKFNLGKSGLQERLVIQLSSSPEYMRTLKPLYSSLSFTTNKSKGFYTAYSDSNSIDGSPFEKIENDKLYFRPNVEAGIRFDNKFKQIKEEYVSKLFVGVLFSGNINYTNLQNGSPFLNSDMELSTLGTPPFIKETRKIPANKGNTNVICYITNNIDLFKFPLNLKLKDWREVFRIVYKI